MTANQSVETRLHYTRPIFEAFTLAILALRVTLPYGAPLEASYLDWVVQGIKVNLKVRQLTFALFISFFYLYLVFVFLQSRQAPWECPLVLKSAI